MGPVSCRGVTAKLRATSYTKSLKRDSHGDFQISCDVIQGGEQRRFAMPIPLRADFDAQMV